MLRATSKPRWHHSGIHATNDGSAKIQLQTTLSAVNRQEAGVGLVSPVRVPQTSFLPQGKDRRFHPPWDVWWELLKRDTPRPWDTTELDWEARA